jgi:hypothetical protein
MEIDFGLGSFVFSNLWLLNQAWDLNCEEKGVLVYSLDVYKIKFSFELPKFEKYLGFGSG